MPRGKTKSQKEEVKPKAKKVKTVKAESKAKKPEIKKNKLVVRQQKRLEPIKDYSTPVEAKIMSVQSAGFNQSVGEEKGRIVKQKIYDRADREKKMIMWSGVTFFMVLVIGFWLFNLKTVFKVDASNNNNSNLGLADITNNLSKTMDEVSKSLDKFNNLASTTATSTASNTPESLAATSTVSTTVEQVAPTSTVPAVSSSQAEIEALKTQLEQLQNKINSATTTKAQLPAN